MANIYATIGVPDPNSATDEEIREYSISVLPENFSVEKVFPQYNTLMSNSAIDVMDGWGGGPLKTRGETTKERLADSPATWIGHRLQQQGIDPETADIGTLRSMIDTVAKEAQMKREEGGPLNFLTKPQFAIPIIITAGVALGYAAPTGATVGSTGAASGTGMGVAESVGVGAGGYAGGSGITSGIASAPVFGGAGGAATGGLAWKGLINKAISGVGKVGKWIEEHPTTSSMVLNAASKAMSPDEIDLLQEEQRLASSREDELRRERERNLEVDDITLGVRPSEKRLMDLSGNPVYNNKGIINRARYA